MADDPWADFKPQTAPKAAADPWADFNPQAKKEVPWSEVPLEAVKNIPSSAWEFGKNVAQPVIHPWETAKSLGELGGGVLQHLGLMSGEEHKPAADAVGKFLMDRYGSIDAIKNTIATDPVGLAGDLSMILSGGGSAVARLPGIAGKVGEAVSAAGRYTNPLTPVAVAAAPVARAAGRTATEALGLTTGTGAEAITQAAKAGYEGGPAAQAFREHITGAAPITEPVTDAEQVLAGLRSERGAAYRDAMNQLGRSQTQPLNFDLVDRALAKTTQVKTYKGVPFDEPQNVSNTRKQIAQAIQKWKMLPPTDYHTAEGLDALKQQIGGIRDGTQFGTPERVVANQAYGALRQTIINAAPEYAQIMKGYEQASDRLRELQQELSIPTPDRGRVDTSLRKLQSVLRNNVNTSFGRRQELADYLVKNGAPELMYKLAGQSLQPWTPRGLSRHTLGIGEAMLGLLGLTGHVAPLTALPAAVAGAALASPRAIGEAAYWGGAGARRAVPYLPARTAFPPAAAIGEITNAAQQPYPRQAGGGVSAIGGTGGRSPRTKTSACACEACKGTGQALQDGGAAGDQTGPTIKPGTREHWAALMSSRVHSGPTTSGGLARGKPPAAMSYNDVVEFLRRRGITGEAAGSFSSYSPEAQTMQEGGEVDEEKLPLPGQSRGLRSTAGPTVSSTMREEEIPAPKVNKAGETLPTFVLKEWGKGLAHMMGTPARAYRGELEPGEAEEWGPAMALTMLAPGRPPSALGSGLGRRPPGPPRLRPGEIPAADRPVTAGHNLPPEETPLTAPPRATSSLSLRDMPLDKAIEQAKTEQHIIPSNPKVREGYVGAPDWVKTPEDLQRMRDSFDAQVEAGQHGAKWYREAQEGIKEMAGPEPERQHLLAQEKAITSAQATPETNLGFAIAGHNAIMSGRPAPIVRTGEIAEKMREGVPIGEIKLGRKTGIYSRHMDPTVEDPATGTNDIWHARAFGYENPEGGLHAQQHAFMDAETVLAVARANEKKLGGRSDWTPGEVQAAPWVYNKAGGLQEQFGWSPERAMAEAVKTYPQFFEKHTAMGTHEATPGIGVRQLPGIAEGTQAEREAFAARPESSWRDPTGRDLFYRALGMWTRPTTKATGIFEGPKGLEINPAEVARPMVGFTGKAGERVVDPASRAMLDAAEAARAYIDAQNAGAWSIPIAKQKTGVSTSLYTPRPGGAPLPIEDVGRLQAIGGPRGLPGVIDYGEGTALTSFGGGPTGRELAKAGREGLGQEVESVLGRQPMQVRLDTGYIDYGKLWGKEEGTGAVTRALKKRLTNKNAPAIIVRLDASPGIRHAVAARLQRDIDVAVQTGQPIRRDLQLARQLIIDGGFAGLFEALKQGAAVPALALAPLVKLLAQREEEPVE